MKPKRWIGLLVLTLILIPASLAQAATFRSSTQTDLVIPGGQPSSNLYTLGQNLTVDAPIKGDLAAAGQTVVVDGNIQGSLFALGQTINVRGNVGDHVRAAGSTVTVSGTIGGDLLVAGQQVTIESGSTINGDLYVTGSQTTINGTVRGNVVVNGPLTLGSTAHLDGRLSYRAAQKAAINHRAVIAGPVQFHQQVTSARSQWQRLISTPSLLLLVGWLLLGYLLIWLAPAVSRRIIQTAVDHVPSSIGWGLVAIIGTPIILVLLIVTVIGLPIAAVAGSIWLAIALVGALFGKISLGALITHPFSPKSDWRLDGLTVLVGVVVMALIDLIPVIGPIVVLIFWLLGIGAAFRVASQQLRRPPSL